MKNVLSDSQKFKLANWLVENKDKEFSRTSAAWTASSELDFDVTYSNMQSAENTTGISLVKVKEPKAVNNHEARMAKLEMDMFNLLQICIRLDAAENRRAHRENENLNIKPSSPKPTICHKHG